MTSHREGWYILVTRLHLWDKRRQISPKCKYFLYYRNIYNKGKRNVSLLKRIQIHEADELWIKQSSLRSGGRSRVQCTYDVYERMRSLANSPAPPASKYYHRLSRTQTNVLFYIQTLVAILRGQTKLLDILCWLNTISCSLFSSSAKKLSKVANLYKKMFFPMSKTLISPSEQTY